MVKSGQAWVVEFVTTNATGALADADSLPSGVLVVNGTDNAASVTVAKITTGRYKASVTLPALTAGDVVAMSVTATIGGVATGGIALQDTADTVLVSDVDAVLTDIKGAGWTTETLVAIQAAIATRLATSGYTAPPSAAAVADAVADELLSGHTTPGSAGAAWAAAGSAADPLTNAVPGSYAAGTAGYALGSIDEIKAQTDLIVDGAAVVAAPYSGGLMTITRGSSLSAVVPLTVDLAGRLRLQFAVKRRPGHETDAEAVIYGTEAAGLSRLNGAAYTGSAGHLALTVSAGVSVTVALDDAVTAQLTPESGLTWALQYETAVGVVAEVSGACVVVADVVRTV